MFSAQGCPNLYSHCGIIEKIDKRFHKCCISIEKFYQRGNEFVKWNVSSIIQGKQKRNVMFNAGCRMEAGDGSIVWFLKGTPDKGMSSFVQGKKIEKTRPSACMSSFVTGDGGAVSSFVHCG